MQAAIVRRIACSGRDGAPPLEPAALGAANGC